MKVAVVDFDTKTITVHEIDATNTDAFLELCHKAIDCQMLDRAYVQPDLVAWVDDMGLYTKQSLTLVRGYDQPLAGNIVFTGADTVGGYSRSVPDKYLEEGGKWFRENLLALRKTGDKVH